MRQPRIAIIVGGHGECEAVPILIRRIASEIDESLSPVVLHPFRVHEDRLRKEAELERYIELAARKLDGNGGVLVLIDCDWSGSCPKVDAPPLLRRARACRPDMKVSVVLANREFEAWFIAASRSISGKRGLRDNLDVIDNPESVRGAKEWLRDRMPPGRPYTETEDQPALTQEFDMKEALRALSFDKCYREIRWLLTDSDE
jgi:hypothetical protein